MFIRSLTYTSIEYIRKNYSNVYKDINKQNITLEKHLVNTIGYDYSEQSKFLNPKLKFYMDEMKDPKKTDYNNSKLIYNAFKNLTESQASDFRLWSGYAATEDVYNYLKYRWKDNDKTILYRVVSHAKGKRGLAYHGIARLWWFAHLTYDENLSDPYELTKFTFSYPHIMEKMIYRNFSNSRNIRFGIIKGIKKYIDSGGFYKTSKLDSLYKHISLISGTHLLDFIPQKEITKISVEYLNELD